MLLLLLTVLGLAIGSFLNVCIHRMPLGQSVAHPRSRCPHCGHELAWYENVPVISYLALGARCRACRARISLRYPLVELATAGLFVGTYALVGLSPLLIPRLVLGCALIVLMLIDLDHRILPNSITLPGVGVGLLFSLTAPPGWVDSLIGALVGGGLLLAIAKIYSWVRHEEGLGMGDVKMLAMIGAFLGWKLMLVTLVLSSFAGAAVGLILIALRRGDMKYALPFGTFLALGALVAGTVGDRLLAWYLGFY
ncbi:MAG TPA: prepilin peptidase [Vicinamibacterales bacterium]|nr:prepilin peptidase [Vicinamibacterales bacterium]